MVNEKDEQVRKVVFSRYELGRLLGQGTFAKVYKSRDLLTGDAVAIKIISKDSIRREPSMADQIRREISVMRLVRHPNIVELREVLATRSKIFFVMELARGGELFARVARGRLPEDLSRKYFRQLISAVDFCHSRGVSHRDLKPENLLLDDNGDLKVSDFGLSALPEQLRHDGMLHTACGTPAYVAPEVLRKKGYDGAAADIWSCGVVLFVLLAGFPPFQDENLMKMYCKIFKAEYVAPPWFSPDARRLVSRLLVADPKKRITISAIQQLPWFKIGNHNYIPLFPPRSISAPPLMTTTAVDEFKEDEEQQKGMGIMSSVSLSPKFYNAFELIAAMSTGFDLSGMFEPGKRSAGTVFTSKADAVVIIQELERIGKEKGLRVERSKDGSCVVKMERREEGRKGKLVFTAEVFEAAPNFAVVELRKDSGDTLEYEKFCGQDVRLGLKDIVWTWKNDGSDLSSEMQLQ